MLGNIGAGGASSLPQLPALRLEILPEPFILHRSSGRHSEVAAALDASGLTLKLGEQRIQIVDIHAFFLYVRLSFSQP